MKTYNASRRASLGWILILSISIATIATALSLREAQAAEPAVAVAAIESVSVTVSDADRSADFYQKVLTFERISDTEAAGADVEALYGVFGARVRTVTLKLGSERLRLLQFIAPRGRPMPVDSHGNDRWFQHVAIIVSDMDKAYARLREYHVEHASTGPQLLPAWNPNAGGISAFYFRDPDGHFLEILHFPPDKGDKRWQQKSSSLFLGIDHTAIVVADTDASLKFYRDTLGMKVAGTSENYGTEQEHLNNVFGARLRITALRAGTGPGVELLEYLAPRDGRPMPGDTHCNDLWHWQVNMRGPAASLDQNIRERQYPHIPVPASTDITKSSSDLFVADPDGHAVLVQQP